MIKSVTVINHLGEALRMELQRPEASGFYIRSIEGLGPVQASVNIVENAILDGASFNSARVGYRNIVLNLGFAFSNDIEEVRHKSYKYFPPKKKVTLQIETDTRVCETYGYVEYNSPDIFSKDETTQISVICPNPYFYEAGSNANNVTVFSGAEPAFSFPFSNESLEEDLIVFGEIKHRAEQIVYYSGDIEVGINIFITAIGDVSNIQLYNLTTLEKFSINTSRLKTMLNTDYEIITGDEIVISTIRGEKSITLIRGGVSHNIINCLDRYPDWFQLAVGRNVFMYEAADGEDNLKFRIEYRTVYEGV